MTLTARKQARVRGLQALYGPDPLDPLGGTPWLTTAAATLILDRKLTPAKAWAMYCVSQAVALERLSNLYVEAASLPPLTKGKS